MSNSTSSTDGMSQAQNTHTPALGCNYEAPTFGAGYPDGTCIDGWMWDLDSCDEPGGGLLHGGDMPCPWCNTAEYIEWRGDTPSGNAHQRRIARRVMAKKIKQWADDRSSFPPSRATQR